MTKRHNETDVWADPTPRATFTHVVIPTPRTINLTIQEAADAIEDDLLQGIPRGDTPPFAQARAVLVLLTHCYALQIYRSTEAASLIARDLYFSCLCGENMPEARDLQQFRAENREAIRRCLAAALRFMVEEKMAAGVVTRVNDAHVTEEANRRITMAMFMDSMEPEGEPADDLAAQPSF
jgi:hypothetical protein